MCVCVGAIYAYGKLCMSYEFSQISWHSFPMVWFCRPSHCGQGYHHKIDGLVRDWSNSSALAMELLQSCTKPSTWSWRQSQSLPSTNLFVSTFNVRIRKDTETLISQITLKFARRLQLGLSNQKVDMNILLPNIGASRSYHQISGSRLNIKTVFPSYGIPMLTIRRSRDRLIFNMEIHVLDMTYLDLGGPMNAS